MTSIELKEHLKRWNISQRGAAKMLGINERTMRKYCAGDLVIPQVVQFALLWVANESRGHRNAQGIQNSRKGCATA